MGLLQQQQQQQQQPPSAFGHSHVAQQALIEQQQRQAQAFAALQSNSQPGILPHHPGQLLMKTEPDREYAHTSAVGTTSHLGAHGVGGVIAPSASLGQPSMITHMNGMNAPSLAGSAGIDLTGIDLNYALSLQKQLEQQLLLAQVQQVQQVQQAQQAQQVQQVQQAQQAQQVQQVQHAQQAQAPAPHNGAGLDTAGTKQGDPADLLLMLSSVAKSDDPTTGNASNNDGAATGNGAAPAVGGLNLVQPQQGGVDGKALTTEQLASFQSVITSNRAGNTGTAAHQHLVDASASASQAAIEAASAAAAAAAAAGIPLAATIQRFLAQQQTPGVPGSQLGMNLAGNSVFGGINGASSIDSGAAFGAVGAGVPGVPGAAGATMSSFPVVGQQGSQPASQSPSTTGHTVTV